MILHLAGVGFAIAAIVLYSINMGHIGFWWMCNRYDNYWDSYQTPKPTLSADERRKQEDCLEAKDLLIVSVGNVSKFCPSSDHYTSTFYLKFEI